MGRHAAGKAPEIASIVVTDAFVSENVLAVLPRFAPSLRRLDLSRVMLSPAAMKFIGELTGLESLQLSGCSLTDDSVKPIASLKQLATLDVSGNYGITDKSAGLWHASLG